MKFLLCPTHDLIAEETVQGITRYRWEPHARNRWHRVWAWLTQMSLTTVLQRLWYLLTDRPTSTTSRYGWACTIHHEHRRNAQDCG